MSFESRSVFEHSTQRYLSIVFAIVPSFRLLSFLNSHGKKISADLRRRNIQNTYNALDIRLFERKSAVKFCRELAAADTGSVGKGLLGIALFADKAEKRLETGTGLFSSLQSQFLNRPLHTSYALSKTE